MNPTNPMSFKAGTYKGMDLTFGGEEHFGGILIRAIMTAGGEYIDGPCNSVSALLKDRGVNEFKELNLKSWPAHDGDAFDKSNGLVHLSYSAILEKNEPVTSARVGLTLKRYDLHKEKYWLEDLRYLTYP